MVTGGVGGAGCCSEEEAAAAAAAERSCGRNSVATTNAGCGGGAGEKKTEDFDVEDAETFALPADEERGKLVDPFYWLEHQEEDLQKKKEAEPLLVRLHKVSDSRHSEDYNHNRALRDRLRDQKRNITQEEDSSRKMALGIQLLPPSKEGAASAAGVRFSSKFERNSKDKRAAIKVSLIFPESSKSGSKWVELESKRRKIRAGAASVLLAWNVKPSSWLQNQRGKVWVTGLKMKFFCPR